MLRHSSRFILETGVVCGLSAAGLIDGEGDGAGVIFENTQNGFTDLGEQAVDQTGDEQLKGHASHILQTTCPGCYRQNRQTM